jgi:hypothetical protein
LTATRFNGNLNQSKKRRFPMETRKVTTKTYNPKTGKLTETPLTPEESASLQQRASKLYLPDGRTPFMARMMEKAPLREPAKRKLLPAA